MGSKNYAYKPSVKIRYFNSKLQKLTLITFRCKNCKILMLKISKNSKANFYNA